MRRLDPTIACRIREHYGVRVALVRILLADAVP
jgi:hypothetical protein